MVTWTGSFTGSGTFYTAWDEDDSLNCSAPACDTFQLEVADGPANLRLKLRVQTRPAAGGTGGGGFRVTKPDGTRVWAKGDSGPETDFVLNIRGATNGNYRIDAVASYICCGTNAYEASAELLLADAPPGGSPPAGDPAPTPPSGGGSQGGGSGQAQDFSLQAKAGRLSARKVNKRRSFGVAVTTSRRIQNVTAQLAKGKKVLGKGRLAPFPGKGTVKLKFRKKLKAGRYKLTVRGIDGNVIVSRTVSLKVKR